MSDAQAPDWVTLAGIRLRVDNGQVIIPPLAGAEEPEGEVQDTPTDDATLHAEDTAVDQTPESGQEDVDWQKRYSDLQPEYTRATQRVKELEPLGEWKPFVDAFNNPQSQRDAINWLLERAGLELDTDDAEYENGDEIDDPGFRDPRVDALLEQQQQRDFQETIGQLNGHVDQLLKGADVELTPKQRNALLTECVQAGLNPQATEQVVAGWVEEVKGFRDTTIKSYLDGKRKQPVPPVKPGASGTEHVPLDTEKARRKAALDVANEAFAD